MPRGTQVRIAQKPRRPSPPSHPGSSLQLSRWSFLSTLPLNRPVCWGTAFNPPAGPILCSASQAATPANAMHQLFAWKTSTPQQRDTQACGQQSCGCSSAEVWSKETVNMQCYRERNTARLASRARHPSSFKYGLIGLWHLLSGKLLSCCLPSSQFSDLDDERGTVPQPSHDAGLLSKHCVSRSLHAHCHLHVFPSGAACTFDTITKLHWLDVCSAMLMVWHSQAKLQAGASSFHARPGIFQRRPPQAKDIVEVRCALDRQQVSTLLRCLHIKFSGSGCNCSNWDRQQCRNLESRSQNGIIYELLRTLCNCVAGCQSPLLWTRWSEHQAMPPHPVLIIGYTMFLAVYFKSTPQVLPSCHKLHQECLSSCIGRCRSSKHQRVRACHLDVPTHQNSVACIKHSQPRDGRPNSGDWVCSGFPVTLISL